MVKHFALFTGADEANDHLSNSRDDLQNKIINLIIDIYVNSIQNNYYDKINYLLLLQVTNTQSPTHA